MPGAMRAFVLTGHGGPDRLEYRTDWPRPAPGPGEALVRVLACGLNNTDVNTRTAWYAGAGAAAPAGGEDGGWSAAVSFPRIQGADICGTVEALGPGADPALLGRRVLADPWLRDWSDPLDLARCGVVGSEGDGGFAEFAVLDARNLHPVESALTDAELATFPVSWITAENMLNRAGVGAGDTVLVPGASGGVGSALVQLAKRRGAAAVAMCGADKAERVRALGPAAVLPREPAGGLRAALAEATGSETVSVVADTVGGPTWPALIDAVARGGRYVCAGAIAGAEVAFDLRVFYLRDLTFHGATVPPPGAFADLVGYIERGEVRPLLAGVWPLERLREAQAAFLRKAHVGNIVAAP